MRTYLTSIACLLTALCVTSCADHQKIVPTPTLSISPFATGLVGPIGVGIDPTGRVFVSESGTGKNDSRIMLVAADGKTYPLVTGLPSVISPGGEPGGTDHLLYADGLLYALNNGFLYKINVAGFQPGNAPIAGAGVAKEDIATWVVNYNFVNDTGESHPYNMITGPDGDIYITDAAANAILRRSKTGQLSVMTEVPGFANPTPVGPPVVQSVPTGITYDGSKFLISTLLGFPFPSGKAILYQMDLTGKLTIQKQVFNPLVDVEVDGNGGALTLEYGTFGQMGWNANTGRLLRSNSTGDVMLFDKLNQPTDLKLYGNNTAYIVIYGDGTLQKVTF
ncbi:MAG: ScyD/ScyE family protein [Spirosoma sp.]|nr:ScyD/ScyE family protein [Spirosoma sp.]